MPTNYVYFAPYIDGIPQSGVHNQLYQYISQSRISLSHLLVLYLFPVNIYRFLAFAITSLKEIKLSRMSLPTLSFVSVIYSPSALCRAANNTGDQMGIACTRYGYGYGGYGYW